MLKNVEFYYSLDKEKLMLEDLTTGEVKTLNIELLGDVKELDKQIKKLYPLTHEKLCKKFGVEFHSSYARVYQFLCCNLGIRDGIADIDEDGNFHLEKTSCPIRHICKDDFCKPILDTTLSKRESEILKLFYKGLNDEEIGQSLFITSGTVHNHITNIYEKLDFTFKPHPGRHLMAYIAGNKLY